MSGSATLERERPAAVRSASKVVTGLGSEGDRKRPLARRVWQALKIAAGLFPLTPLGLLAIPVLRGLWRVYGVGHNDRIVLVLGACGLAVIAAAVLIVLATAIWLRFRRRPAALDAISFEAGSSFRTGFNLGQVGWNPLVKIDLAWEQPSGVEVELIPGRTGFVEQITARERAQYGEVVRRIRVSDVFGLSRITFRSRAAQAVTILPASGRVQRIDLVQQLVAGDEVAHPEGKPQGDLIEMRRYSPGDPLKLVLWKVYARTGRMLVRTPEKAVARSQKTLAYMVAGNGDEPSAGTARAVLENGSLGTDFWFGADGQDGFTRIGREALDRVVRSAGARDRGGEGLGPFLGRGEELGVKACLLFVPSQPGAWLRLVEGHLARHAGPFRILIGTDGVPQPSSSPRLRTLRRLLLDGEAEGETMLAGLCEVVRRLAQTDAEVCVVDRITGRNYHPAELPASVAARSEKGGRS